MSWIVKFEKEVETCDDCPLYLTSNAPAQYCQVDGQKAVSKYMITRMWLFPCEIRPCPLKVHATPIDVNEANKQSEKDYSFETGV